MTYVPTIWQENAMTQTQKINGLNNLETQAADGLAYIDAFLHDDTYYIQALATSTFFRTAAHPSGRNDGPGSGLNAASVDGYTLAQLQALAIPSGAIALWGKSVASISASWLFMNGQNGTIDTRGRILICSGNGYSPGTLGGAASVTPYANAFDLDPVILTTNQIPRHQHSYSDKYNPWGPGSTGGSHIYPTPRTVATSSVSGIPNIDPIGHPHENNTFTWTGYYDENNVYHAGSLPLLVKSRAYAWILKR